MCSALLGLNDELAHSSLRFSFGRFTTEDDVDHAADCVRHAVDKLRELHRFGICIRTASISTRSNGPPINGFDAITRGVSHGLQ